MPRDSRLYLRDMVDEARFIEEHAQGLAFDVFVSDEVLVRAVLNSLAGLGEAARAMPEEVRQRALVAAGPRANQGELLILWLLLEAVMNFGRRAAPVLAPHPRSFPRTGGRKKPALAPSLRLRGGRDRGMGGCPPGRSA